jgi:DNA-binding YbaB/EbfC family protein
MGFNPGNMNKMMKQYQKMQQDLMRVQAELADLTVEATAGGGMVRVVFNGHGELRDLSIKPEAVDPNDVEMLQDLLVAAFKEGQQKAQQLAQEKLEAVTGGLNLPGGLR